MPGTPGELDPSTIAGMTEGDKIMMGIGGKTAEAPVAGSVAGGVNAAETQEQSEAFDTTSINALVTKLDGERFSTSSPLSGEEMATLNEALRAAQDKFRLACEANPNWATQDVLQASNADLVNWKKLLDRYSSFLGEERSQPPTAKETYDMAFYIRKFLS